MRGNLDGVNNEYAMGWALDTADPYVRPEVEVFYNGRSLGRTTASFPRDDVRVAGVGDGRNGYFMALPLLTESEDAEVWAVEVSTGTPLGEHVRLTRQPQCSRGGILAADVLGLQELTLHSVQSMDLNGAQLRVRGIHQPPAGNPAALRVTSTEGTPFTLDYPLASPNIGSWYWYWPNAGFSGFTISVELAECTDEGPHYTFDFEVDEAVTGVPNPPKLDAFGRNRVWIPKDLGAYQNFPRAEQMTRVQRFDGQNRVALAGYSDHMRMRLVAEQYGVDVSSANILDWGCGHGRVLRHFTGHAPVAEAWGVDIDAENVGWVSANLSDITTQVVPLMPPTELPSDHFDFIYAISVMTHLTSDAQQAWLEELRRIARPGAIIALTFCGNSGVAFSSRFLSPEFLESYQAEGFDDSQVNADLEGLVGDDTYYRNTRQLPDQVREAWSEHLEVVDIFPCVFGYQDLAVLRVPE